jgi:hypothetical protein
MIRWDVRVNRFDVLDLKYQIFERNELEFGAR